MFFFCSYHHRTPMSNILYDRTLRDKPFLDIDLFHRREIRHRAGRSAIDGLRHWAHSLAPAGRLRYSARRFGSRERMAP